MYPVLCLSMFQKDKVLSPSQELSGEVLPGLQVLPEKMCLRGSSDTDFREAVRQWARLGVESWGSPAPAGASGWDAPARAKMLRRLTRLQSLQPARPTDGPGAPKGYLRWT